MKQKGFTLIELMVVIVILGILAGIAIPKMFGLSDKSKVSEAPTVLKTYETLQQAYIAEKSVIGSFESITFNKPTASQYFTYNDDNSAWANQCGRAEAVSKVKIGDCAGGKIWAVGVPNGTGETVRRVDDDACSKLSPATFQEIGTVTTTCSPGT